MKTLKSLLFLTFAFTTSFSQTNGHFEIIGTAKGFADNTVIYLRFTDDGTEKVDSAIVNKEKFTFKGSLKSKTVNALIRRNRDYKFFWLENETITFKGEAGNFRASIITGSKTQDEQDALDRSTLTLPQEQRTRQEIKFVREHTQSIIAAYYLSVYSSTWGKDTTTVLYNRLSDELKNSAYGKSIFDFISINKGLKVGDKYADFAQPDAHNKLVSLSDFANKVVLLDFWGSWCGPCRQNNSDLVKIYGEFKARGFEILGVAAETDRGMWLKAIEKDQITWPNVTELKGDKNKAALMYGVSYYPTNFLIDKNGTIIARDLQGDKLREKLVELLN